MMQDVPTDHGVEGGMIGKPFVRTGYKIDLAMSLSPRSGSRHFDGVGLAIERDDVASFANCLGDQHGQVTGAATDFKHAHARHNTAFANQPPADVGDDAGLELQTLNLDVRMTQDVGRCGAHVSTRHAKGI